MLKRLLILFLFLIPLPAFADQPILFGRYEGEPIEWAVLDESETDLLLISRFVLDRQPYHNKASHVTWPECTLRTWLNDAFLNAAFTPEEQERIELLAYSLPAGRTEDRVILLPLSQVKEYFPSDEERICTDLSGNTSTWWLRSANDTTSKALAVGAKGNLWEMTGNYIKQEEGVRPVIRLLK